MAYTTINKATDFFNSIVYTGNATNSTARTVGHQPDFVWIKNRGGDSHYLIDRVRGFDYNVETDTNLAHARDYLISGVTSTGWTSSNSGEINANNGNFASWSWKGSGSTTNDTTSGYVPNTQTVNDTAGFTCLKYTGTGTNTVTNTGLSTPLDFSVTKRIDSTGDWVVFHRHAGGTLGQSYFWLNSVSGRLSSTTIFQNIAPQMDGSISYQAMGANSPINISGAEYISYGWSQREGYSKFGSYTGNGSTDGIFIYTGFRPIFLLAKSTGTDDWRMVTENVNTRNQRNNEIDKNLYAHSNSAETNNNVDFVSNGVKIRNTSGGFNGSGQSYIYMAFGQSLVGSNNVPCTAR